MPEPTAPPALAARSAGSVLPGAGRAHPAARPAGGLPWVHDGLTDTVPMPAVVVDSTRRLLIAGRALMLVVVGIAGVLTTRSPAPLLFVVLLALAGLPSVAVQPQGWLATAGRVVETLVTCLGAGYFAHHAHDQVFAAPGAAAGAILPYLVVPPVSAAVARRGREAAVLLGLGAVTLIGLGLLDSHTGDRGFAAEATQWMLLATAATAIASALRRVLAQPRATPQPYAEATRLLTQLRTVARQLPGATLDPGSLAEHLLDDVKAVARYDRAAVLSASGGSRLVVLAQAGVDRVDWETSLDSDSLIAEAWASQMPQVAARSQARTHPGGEVSALVLPLAAGVRTVGLLTIEADAAGAYPPSVVNRVAALAAPAALRMEAALLFDDVRALATNEERQRLAREIHDGVAQELVMVGYGIDNTLAVLPDSGADAAGEELRALRAEVTRVITELRLSLFELRSEVDRHGGLAAAISEYARTVGASAGLRVHMSLDESTARLPASTEAELLRIAQEAITNARKHAGAGNLWVTCTVDPPYASVEVSDDGQGMAEQRPEGRYGLAIMAERAERIRGRLEIRPRQPSGTTVAIVIGTAPRRGSAHP